MLMLRAQFALALSSVLAAVVPTCVAQAGSGSIVGARRFAQFCAGCHGVDGRGGDKAVSLVSNQTLMSRPDGDLYRIVHDGTPNGMPPFAQIGDANIAAVVQYLRHLEEDASANGKSPQTAAAGNPEAGRGLFFGSAGCSQCHMVRGEGGFIAANLTTYARNRSANAVLQAITTPDSPLQPGSQVVKATTNSGENLSGVLRNEDEFNVAIQTEDGHYHLLKRSDLASIDYSDHSLMPLDYGSRFTSRELDDIVSFLVASSKAPQTPQHKADSFNEH